jgi:SAM-dependent methyltransferase
VRLNRDVDVNARVARLLYEVLTRIGLNPALAAADVPDTWLVELVEGERRLEPGRALDLGCGAGRNTRYLTRHGWDALGIDLIGGAIEKARSQTLGDAAEARFLQGDVTRLTDLDLGDAFDLINDSGCYYGLPSNQRDAYAAGVTQVAAPNAVLLMAGFTKIPGVFDGIAADDLRRRFHGWEVRTDEPIPVDEIKRHTHIPLPLRAALRSGNLRFRRFELFRAGT